MIFSSPFSAKTETPMYGQIVAPPEIIYAISVDHQLSQLLCRILYMMAKNFITHTTLDFLLVIAKPARGDCRTVITVASLPSTFGLLPLWSIWGQ